jgi:hypothetical protein
MKVDPTIAEVRRARTDISRRCGNDPDRLLGFLDEFAVSADAGRVGVVREPYSSSLGFGTELKETPIPYNNRSGKNE